MPSDIMERKRIKENRCNDGRKGGGGKCCGGVGRPRRVVVVTSDCNYLEGAHSADRGKGSLAGRLSQVEALSTGALSVEITVARSARPRT